MIMNRMSNIWKILGATLLFSFAIFASDRIAEVSAQIKQAGKEKDDVALARHVRATLSELGGDNRAAMECLLLILVEVELYLKATPKPDKSPQLNVAPPNGGLAGIAPADIKDETSRAEYEKAIADNNALIESHRKHSAMERIQSDTAFVLTGYRHSESGSDEIFRQLINKLGLDKELSVRIDNITRKRQ